MIHTLDHPCNYEVIPAKEGKNSVAVIIKDILLILLKMARTSGGANYHITLLSYHLDQDTIE